MPKKLSKTTDQPAIDKPVKQMVLMRASQQKWLHETAARTGQNMSDIFRTLLDQAMQDSEFDLKLRRITLEARLNALVEKQEAVARERETTQKELQNLVKE